MKTKKEYLEEIYKDSNLKISNKMLKIRKAFIVKVYNRFIEDKENKAFYMRLLLR